MFRIFSDTKMLFAIKKIFMHRKLFAPSRTRGGGLVHVCINSLLSQCNKTSKNLGCFYAPENLGQIDL